MKIIKGFFWILLFTVIGEALAMLIPLTIPGPVYGLVLFFIALEVGWVPMDDVEDLGSWLAANMGIMFVPSGVGIVNNMTELAQNWWQILIILLVVTFAVMGTIGFVTQAMSKQESEDEK